MPSYSWWQAIQVLAGREPGDGDVSGITDWLPYLELEPEPVLALLADSCAAVLGVPFDGQVHAPIPADAWRQIKLEIRSDPPFAVGDERFGVVAVLRAGQGGAGRGEVRGWGLAPPGDHRARAGEAEGHGRAVGQLPDESGSGRASRDRR